MWYLKRTQSTCFLIIITIFGIYTTYIRGGERIKKDHFYINILFSIFWRKQLVSREDQRNALLRGIFFCEAK